MSISPQGSSSAPVTLQIQIQSPNTPKPPVPTTTPDQFSLADNTEIHKAKMGASFWAGYFGFFKTGWDALFYNTEKAASKRKDVLSHQRSFESGLALEKEKKKAQQKASIIPAIVVTTLTAITLGKLVPLLKKYIPEMLQIGETAKKYKTPDAELKKEIDAIYEKMEKDPLIEKVAKTFLVTIPLGFLNLVLAPLLYGFFEKPESPDFNKQL